MPGRIPLESLAGIAWNPWPESNGITGRDHVECMAGIVWNLQLDVHFFSHVQQPSSECREVIARSCRWALACSRLMVASEPLPLTLPPTTRT